jgi:acyl CoA:acetate/3-ketoacid CoA transferase alpha subunit
MKTLSAEQAADMIPDGASLMIGGFMGVGTPELIVDALYLTYALTARNFNPVIASAADVVVVEAEHIVPTGVIAPDHVMTPAPLVDYVIAH